MHEGGAGAQTERRVLARESRAQPRAGGHSAHGTPTPPLARTRPLGDPAAAALLAIATGAAVQFRNALPTATGRARHTILQALGVLKDVQSAQLIGKIADATADQEKVTALWALANMGDAGSIDRLLKAADNAKGYLRSKATQACLILAENLADAGKRADAIRMYQYLKSHRIAPDEKHIRDAAIRGLVAIG